MTVAKPSFSMSGGDVRRSVKAWTPLNTNYWFTHQLKQSVDGVCPQVEPDASAR